MPLNRASAARILEELYDTYDYQVDSQERAIAAAEREDFTQFASFVATMTETEFQEFAQSTLPSDEFDTD